MHAVRPEKPCLKAEHCIRLEGHPGDCDASLARMAYRVAMWWFDRLDAVVARVNRRRS